MLETCNFCRKFGQNGTRVEPYDKILFQSQNFVAVPTRGSIVPGWVLIVPRNHFLCIGAFDSETFSEFIMFRAAVAEALRSAFGPVAFFEHGPATPSTLIGCGVDHAHLHIVATSADLREGADRIATGALRWTSLDHMRALSNYHAEGLAYLYVEQFGNSFICSPETIESQLFRKVIASVVGEPSKYDWKQHCFRSAVEVTVSEIARLKARAPASSALQCA